MFDFEYHEINRTKILGKRWCTRLQIRVEGVKGEDEAFTYPPAFFFLPLGFENFNKSFIEYSTVTFGFDPYIYFTDRISQTHGVNIFGACNDINKLLLN